MCGRFGLFPELDALAEQFNFDPSIMQDNIGRIIAWVCETANVHDTRLHHLIERFERQTIVLGDTGFHRGKGTPPISSSIAGVSGTSL